MGVQTGVSQETKKVGTILSKVKVKTLIFSWVDTYFSKTNKMKNLLTHLTYIISNFINFLGKQPERALMNIQSSRLFNLT